MVSGQEKAKKIEGLLVRKLEEMKNQRAECASATSEANENSSQSGDDSIADFLKELQRFKESLAGSQSFTRIVLKYLSGDLAPVTSLIEPIHFKEKFVRYNKPIPSSASVE